VGKVLIYWYYKRKKKKEEEKKQISLNIQHMPSESDKVPSNSAFGGEESKASTE